MTASTSLVDLAPSLRLLLLAALLALLPLAWWWLRQRGAAARARLAALTTLTLFLTFDLIVFGSFTRLTDSGLGCPDWPGCYGAASPVGAQGDIQAAQSALPSGPVTLAKAWIEMIHRYLAMVVGALILVAAVVSWRRRAALPHSPWWPTLTLAWVIVQGLFGKYTVTLKLYPAVVTLHLLGAMVLLALLVLQRESFRDQAMAPAPSRTPPGAVALVGALVFWQIALGGWVSTNYAVLACQGFPACNGQWWPATDLAGGFAVLRPLGQDGAGGYLRFDALVAIHLVHRLAAVVVLAALVWLSLRLWRSGLPAQRQYAALLGGLLVWQGASGLSNVVLGWPIGAALAHSAGAAALVATLVSLWARLRTGALVAARLAATARPRRATRPGRAQAL